MLDGLTKAKACISARITFPWFVVAVASILMMLVAVNIATFGVFFKPIAGEFDWSRAALSGAFAMRSLVMAVFGAAMGYWSERYGPRRVLLACLLLAGLGMAVINRVTELWQMYLVQGLVLGIAASGPFVCLTGVIGRWHRRRLGLALGIVAAGNGMAFIIFAPLATRLIEAMGWRNAIVVLGLAVVVLGALGASMLKNPPVAEDEHKAIAAGPSGVRGIVHGWRLFLPLLRDPSFRPLILMTLFFAAATMLVTTHLVNYLTDIGISPAGAAGMMSAFGGASALGRLGMGGISDRVGARTGVIVCFTLILISLAMLVGTASLLLIWVAIVLFGFGLGGEVPLMPALIRERFGTEKLATLTGVAFVGFHIGSALGPWLGGAMFDLLGSYSWALVSSAIFAAAALVLTARLRPVVAQTYGTAQASLAEQTSQVAQQPRRRPF